MSDLRIFDNGYVWQDFKCYGRVVSTASHWRAYRLSGQQVPVHGNKAHKTREAAVAALVKAVSGDE